MKFSQTVDLENKFKLDNIKENMEINRILMEPVLKSVTNVELFMEKELKTRN